MCWLRRRQEDVPVLKKFLGLRMSFLSHDIQNELLELMANNVLRQILHEVRESPYFSIIVDEVRLNSLAILTVHREYEPDVDKILSEFIGLNELRQRIFGP